MHTTTLHLCFKYGYVKPNMTSCEKVLCWFVCKLLTLHNYSRCVIIFLSAFPRMIKKKRLGHQGFRNQHRRQCMDMCVTRRKQLFQGLPKPKSIVIRETAMRFSHSLNWILWWMGELKWGFSVDQFLLIGEQLKLPLLLQFTRFGECTARPEQIEYLWLYKV